ncbi:MAG: hypothetical protein KKB59_11055, partial [Spirochaetes bacterium]|nr:hypothetical protein [Spirochaetota bacterium]
ALGARRFGGAVGGVVREAYSRWALVGSGALWGVVREAYSRWALVASGFVGLIVGGPWLILEG